MPFGLLSLDEIIPKECMADMCVLIEAYFIKLMGWLVTQAYFSIKLVVGAFIRLIISPTLHINRGEVHCVISSSLVTYFDPLKDFDLLRFLWRCDVVVYFGILELFIGII